MIKYKEFKELLNKHFIPESRFNVVMIGDSKEECNVYFNNVKMVNLKRVEVVIGKSKVTSKNDK